VALEEFNQSTSEFASLLIVEAKHLEAICQNQKSEKIYRILQDLDLK
jgi:plasmid maintenance system antidote protein VapI